MSINQGIISEQPGPTPLAPLTLNISDREYVVIGGKDTDDHIILELREGVSSSQQRSIELTRRASSAAVSTAAGSTSAASTTAVSTAAASTSSASTTTESTAAGSTAVTSVSATNMRDKRESLIINSTSISNKPFLDWKLDEAYDEATCTIEIRASRLSNSERETVLSALAASENEADFVKRIRSVKGIFLLDNELLLAVLDKYGDGIYKIIEKLNFRYHLCYLSESIHHELHRRKESLSRFQTLIDKPIRQIQIGGILFAVFLTALCLLLVYIRK